MIELGVIACLVYAAYLHWKEVSELKADKEWWKAKTKEAIALADDSQRSTKEYLRSKGL